MPDPDETDVLVVPVVPVVLVVLELDPHAVIAAAVASVAIAPTSALPSRRRFGRTTFTFDSWTYISHSPPGQSVDRENY
jgi:hypothetical protein